MPIPGSLLHWPHLATCLSRQDLEIDVLIAEEHFGDATHHHDLGWRSKRRSPTTWSAKPRPAWCCASRAAR